MDGDLEYHLWERHNETSPPPDKFIGLKLCRDCGEVISETFVNCPECGGYDFTDPGNIKYL
jgi:hypothetical protein